MINLSVLIIAAIMALSSNLNAAGFRLAEQDAKATGMGNSFVAVADNASAVWYNPAAITGLEGTNLSLGTVMVAPSMEHKNVDGTKDKIKNVLHIPPHFYATHKLNDNVSLGLGVNVPFGLSTEWDKNTAETRALATKSEVKAVNANLNGAYKMNDKFSFAAGVDYVTLNATLNKKIEISALGVNIEQTLKGDGHGVGYNAGALYKHSDNLSFGANYHSKVKVSIDGKMNIPTPTTISPIVNDTKTTDQDASTDITLPDMLEIGAAYKSSDKWLFSAEADYTNWTTYRSIVVDYTQDNGAAAQKIDTKNWKSVWAFRLGSEYKYSDAWKLRAGAFYDMNPVKEKYLESRVPDTDRVAFSVGAGYTKGNITVDASYMYLMFIERKVDSAAASSTLYGKYNSVAHLPALTVSYKF